ncbi:MarR family transcriptional regulator [Staphylococcus epidermidis]|uniref:MarR family transcriptional regulator n=1 Tax=Staphylococcus epidermidis TaxID=1282 RepID=UPI001E3BA0F1|nr:MarR family transcriptional regulator [Staphylococcus epidermidis]MCD8887110.1 MarR family transcriptional regulator [Staphylococcus epidermidis]MCG1130071.1 MarR family transcriptional regulator [Staphylococcus epidermidis]MCG1263345.1 MarR family transcriptional regulator [Staphylococcus epidermidis]MCG1303470.1 MarR family transcriptional regulator [Staphylococcus epidermidis]MCG1361454.1 MarR family transcriptional regulator [Staphylococcus epidermidis]
MSMQKKVILMLQQFIIERENVDKRRQYRKDNEDLDLSLTQFHIIELINKNTKVNNKFLAKELNLSKPAITKSIKKILSKGLVVEIQNDSNKREIYYDLTKKGEAFSFIHDELHEKAVKKYEEVLKVFDDKELEIIMEFLKRSVNELKKEADHNG